jgi:DNA polymerase
VAPQLDSTTRDALLARMRFYRDLGLTEFYRRPVDPALFASVADELAQDDPAEVQSESHNQKIVAPGLASSTWDTTSQPETLYEEQTIPARKSFPAPPQVADAIAPAEREAALRLIREDIGDCTRCALHKGRNKLVFADGSAEARLMFVGEGPGADEDAQGLPFVGRAGQLLNNMIVAMGLKREEVYIANVVKCRPPGNRTPEPEEANTCSPFLFRQIDVVHPEVQPLISSASASPSPACAVVCIQCVGPSSSLPITPPICFAIRARKRKHGPTSRSRCVNWGSSHRRAGERDPPEL